MGNVVSTSKPPKKLVDLLERTTIADLLRSKASHEMADADGAAAVDEAPPMYSVSTQMDVTQALILMAHADVDAAPLYSTLFESDFGLLSTECLLDYLGSLVDVALRVRQTSSLDEDALHKVVHLFATTSLQELQDAAGNEGLHVTTLDSSVYSAAMAMSLPQRSEIAPAARRVVVMGARADVVQPSLTSMSVRLAAFGRAKITHHAQPPSQPPSMSMSHACRPLFTAQTAAIAHVVSQSLVLRFLRNHGVEHAGLTDELRRLEMPATAAALAESNGRIVCLEDRLTALDAFMTLRRRRFACMPIVASGGGSGGGVETITAEAATGGSGGSGGGVGGGAIDGKDHGAPPRLVGSLSLSDLRGVVSADISDQLSMEAMLSLPVLDFLRRSGRLRSPVFVDGAANIFTVVQTMADAQVHHVYVALHDKTTEVSAVASYGIISATDLLSLLTSALRHRLRHHDDHHHHHQHHHHDHHDNNNNNHNHHH